MGKLADFGGSALHNPEGFGKERVVGKSFYMAPEILMLFDEPPAVTRYDGFHADVWSCGIIFFLMLTGGKVAPFAFPHISDRWFKCVLLQPQCSSLIACWQIVGRAGSA